MSISAQQFQDWLFRDHRRCLLVEVTAYVTGTGLVTRYFSNRAFVTGPLDTPANTPYDDILISAPTYSAKLSELFTGRSVPDWGDLVITNENGDRDSWLDDGWDGRPVKMYIGDPDWNRSDFRIILNGILADISSPQRDRLAFKISDKSWMLNVPAQTTLMTGSTANVDQPQPICLGPCFNIEPVLEDAATWKYRVHDGAINAITDVRDNGVSVGHTDTLASGYFVLTSAPSGRITADVQGAKPSGTYLTKCADIINYLVTNHSALTSADIDATNFTAFNTTCPQSLGLYVRDRQNLIDLIDQLVTSVGGYWTFTRAGLLALGRLEAPTGTPVLSITADDVRPRMVSIERREIPITTLRLGYAKNWTVQADGLAGAVTAANKALYAAPYQVKKATDAALLTKFLTAQSPDVRETLLTDGTEAQTEATRLQALYDSVRTVYSVAGYVAPYTVSLGAEISLTHPRFGFAAGADAIVVGLSEEAVHSRITLDLWK